MDGPLLRISFPGRPIFIQFIPGVVAVLDVFGYGAIEQGRLLRHYAQVRSDEGQVQVSDVVALEVQ